MYRIFGLSEACPVAEHAINIQIQTDDFNKKPGSFPLGSKCPFLVFFM